jgi:hypothetical protein
VSVVSSSDIAKDFKYSVSYFFFNSAITGSPAGKVSSASFKAAFAVFAISN